MKYDPELAALLAQPWSNNACRGYVIYAMENCGFSPSDIPKWSKARGRHRRRCRLSAFPHGTRGTVGHCFVSLWKEAHMEDPVPVKEEYTYQVGKIQFIVTPVYKDKGESMRDILLKLMLADLEPA